MLLDHTIFFASKREISRFVTKENYCQSESYTLSILKVSLVIIILQKFSMFHFPLF